MKKSIVWLASYPKSGNTWTRVFLANYLMNAQQPVPINQVHRFGMGDSIAQAYRMVGGPNIDVTDMNVTLPLRARVLRGIVANNADVNFVKTHNTRVPVFGHTLIPDAVSRSGIYIIRNPLDMLLSYARHFGMTHEATAEAIGRDDNANTPDDHNVWQFLGSWSEHVRSWTQPSAFPVLTLRYEDLLAAPEENFGKLLRHIGITVDDERLARAVRHASFDELTKQESATGFVESSPKSEKFFARGKSDQWKTDLAPAIAKKVKRDHRKVMKKFGYLDE
ncbi:MAG: sulfotransferase domain-containing protein [Roseovarius sp.]